jgi:cysteine-rich repeat protein
MGWRTCLLFALAACSNAPPTDVIDPPHCGDGVVQADEGEQCDDGNAISGDGCSSTCKSEGGEPFVHASWNLVTIDGGASACPSADDTATVIATPIDPVTTPYVDMFPCIDGAGNTQSLPAGRYRVKIEIDDLQQPFATSLPEDVTLTAGATDVDADIYTDAGYFAAQWQLQTMTGQPMSCAVAGANEVDIITNDGGGDQLFPFVCGAPGGIAGPLRDGSNYMVRLEAVTGMKLIGVSAIMVKGITGPNTVTDLGTVPIVLGP